MRKRYDKEGKLTNDPFRDMYDSVTDPDIIEKNRHQSIIKNNLNNKKIDTGL